MKLLLLLLVACEWPHPPKDVLYLGCELVQKDSEWALTLKARSAKKEWRKFYRKFPSESEAYDACIKWRHHIQFVYHAEK